MITQFAAEQLPPTLTDVSDVPDTIDPATFGHVSATADEAMSAVLADDFERGYDAPPIDDEDVVILAGYVA